MLVSPSHSTLPASKEGGTSFRRRGRAMPQAGKHTRRYVRMSVVVPTVERGCDW